MNNIYFTADLHWYNQQSSDLRFDVGIDGVLYRKVGAENGTDFALIPLETIYKVAIEKAGSDDLRCYASQTYLQHER